MLDVDDEVALVEVAEGGRGVFPRRAVRAFFRTRWPKILLVRQEGQPPHLVHEARRHLAEDEAGMD